MVDPLSVAKFFVHTGSVKTFQGSGAYGDVFSDPVTVVGFHDGGRKLVRDANGEQVVANGFFYTATTNAPLFTTDSVFTIDGADSRVIVVNSHTSGALGLPDHVEVALT